MPASTDTFSESVASTIRAELGRRRVTITALAVALGMSRQTASQRVSGAHPFGVDELEIVADLLGMSVRELIDAVDRDQRQHRPSERAMAEKRPAA